ncbi:MAG: efflux RND transporter periplasmic adaptor subunit [Gammaproteobacteria bacterium]|nr:efflux RND transporter periplasmic adaptor subunit [Gammaproteobacteria bacterium]
MNSKTLAAIACLTLTACGEAPIEATDTVARPVKSMVVLSPAGSGIRNFPGRIDAVNKAVLAFRVAGTVAALSINTGEDVTKGQVLAQLDQTDFLIALRDRQARFDRAEKDYERARDLVADGAISRRDFDTIEAGFKTQGAALEQTQQNLDYTTLRAPFAGNVALRHIDAFEEIRVGQSIFSIIDPSLLEVQFDIPENLVLLLPGRTSGDQPKNVNVWATFDAAPQLRFELAFKEVATRADAQTQTFAVTFTLPAPDSVTVLPGMTASVMVDLSKALKQQSVYYVPLTAVAGTNELNARVWTVDEDSMTVHERPVTVGRMVGSTVEVTDGLEPGLRIVTAGAAYLAEGMKITLLQQSEQAEPRSDDLGSTD